MFNLKEIFVFGSNLAGIHGAGSAKHAREKHGAELGVGIGRTGNAYAIPTKDVDVFTVLPLDTIKSHVDDFLKYAKDNQDCVFNVVAIGCGLAGYKPEQIAPMFADRSKNVLLPPQFVGLAEDSETIDIVEKIRYQLSNRNIKRMNAFQTEGSTRKEYLRGVLHALENLDGSTPIYDLNYFLKFDSQEQSDLFYEVYPSPKWSGNTLANKVDYMTRLKAYEALLPELHKQFKEKFGK